MNRLVQSFSIGITTAWPGLMMSYVRQSFALGRRTSQGRYCFQANSSGR